MLCSSMEQTSLLGGCEGRRGGSLLPSVQDNRSKRAALLTRAFFKNVRLEIAARRNDHRA